PNQDQTTGVKDLTIPVGEARCVYVDAGLFPNSANGGAVLTFSVRINSDPPVDIPGSVPAGPWLTLVCPHAVQGPTPPRRRIPIRIRRTPHRDRRDPASRNLI